MFSRNSRIFVSCLVITIIAGGVWLVWPTSSESRHSQALPTGSRKPEQTPPGKSVSPSLDSVQAGTSAASITAPQRASAPLIDAILKNQTLDNSGAARALGDLVQDPSLSLDARDEALAHMLNLSAGNEATLLLPLLKSRDLPDSLASTILTDALNSPLAWQADACLAVIARKTGKDLHTQAGEHLAFLTGEEHGDDVNAWTIAVRDARAKWETTEQ